MKTGARRKKRAAGGTGFFADMSLPSRRVWERERHHGRGYNIRRTSDRNMPLPRLMAGIAAGHPKGSVRRRAGRFRLYFAWARVTTLVVTMSSTDAPRERSLTGLAKP